MDRAVFNLAGENELPSSGHLINTTAMQKDPVVARLHALSYSLLPGSVDSGGGICSLSKESNMSF
jgi:hypothetical protein